MNKPRRSSHAAHGASQFALRSAAANPMAGYDGAGDLLWIRQFGTGADDQATGLAPDGAGGVMATGFTGGSLAATNFRDNDAFLAHHDSAGDQLWISQISASSDDYAKAVATDGAGGVLIAGWTGGSLGGPNAGGADAFLARFSVNALPGDLNCDDAFNGGDIDPFFACLGGGRVPLRQVRRALPDETSSRLPISGRARPTRLPSDRARSAATPRGT